MSTYLRYGAADGEAENEVSTKHLSTDSKIYSTNYLTESHSSYLQPDLGHPPCSTSSDPLNQNKQGVPNLNYFGFGESDIYDNKHGRDDLLAPVMSHSSHSKKNGNEPVQCYPSFWEEGELENLEQSSNTAAVMSSSELVHKIPQQRQYPYHEVKRNTNVMVRETTNGEGGYKPKRMRLNEPTDDAHQKLLPGQPARKASRSKLCFFVHHTISPYIGSTPQAKVPQRVVKSISAHAGTVNAIEWCLPQYSHLLLSASMDSTVKIWNVFSSADNCVQTLNKHSKAVKDVEWSISGREVLSCGYDRTARLCDVEKGTEIQCYNHPSFVTCLKYHPINHYTFMTGAHNAIYSWDSRSKGNPVCVYTYKEPFGQVQDLAFLNNGREMISCTDLVSRDSADRTIMAWDVRSKVVLSNQIYQERYTCTKIKCHPVDEQFLVQTNGDYMALFSVNRPYTMNKGKRFEGHKVQGYGIGFDVSLDGSKIVSGSTTGEAVFYDYKTTRVLGKLATGLDVCMDAMFHPVLNSTVAACGWNGAISILQ